VVRLLNEIKIVMVIFVYLNSVLRLHCHCWIYYLRLHCHCWIY